MRVIFGVLLVWGGCGLVGAKACVALGQRVAVLERIGVGLELMERELVLDKTPLPELLERVSKESKGQGETLFSACKTGLEQGKSFTQAWSDALGESELEERERTLLEPLGAWLGRYDAKGQTQALARLRGDWDEHIRSVRRQTGGLVRIYGVLGLTAGGFLALSLL